MSKVKKVYLHPSDLLKVMLVNEPYTRDATGFREQLYPHSELIRVHGPCEIAFANPMTRQVSWGGKTNAVSPPPTDAEVMAHPKVKALVEAVEQEMLRVCNEYSKKGNMAAATAIHDTWLCVQTALAAIQEAKP